MKNTPRPAPPAPRWKETIIKSVWLKVQYIQYIYVQVIILSPSFEAPFFLLFLKITKK